MNARNSSSFATSLMIHGAMLVVLFVYSSRALLETPIEPVLQKTVVPIYAPRLFPQVNAPSRGGAGPDRTPARKGTPPPRVWRAFVAPQGQPDPKLPMPVGIEVEAPVATLDPSEMGDPFAKFPGNSLGSGGPHGIGDRGCCGGVGPGTRDGIGGRGGMGHRIVAPRLIYKVEPEFSEEARKAKFQGTVILVIEVDASGKPSHLVVVSGPGLGLDQKAIEAVAQWRFEPASRDGRPVSTSARIEVNFHLM